MIKYYMFCIKWLWKNRYWKDTRQKFKEMQKEWTKKNPPLPLHKNKIKRK